MDRESFNANQLHEHFDRVKEATGVEFTDNNRMVQLPTGHKFIVGEIDHVVSDDVNIDTHIPLFAEHGQMGVLNLSDSPSKISTGNYVIAGLDLLKEGGEFSKTSFTFSDSGESNTIEAGEHKLHRNPTAGQIDDEIKRIDFRGRNRPRIERPGIVNALGYERATRNAKTLGRFGFNSRTGRYEQVPD